MKRHIILYGLFLFTVLGRTQEKPNVLLIMVDDMNDWVGAFGGNPQAQTPNIDALAQKSTIFDKAYCSAPLCNPSRTSMLTGYNPSTTGVYGNNEKFRDINGFEHILTLPQYFEKNGYTTIAAGKIFHNARGGGKEPKEGSDPGSFQTERIGGAGTKYPEKEDRYLHNLNLKKRGIKGSFTRSFDWFGTATKDQDNNDWKSAEYIGEFINKKHNKPFFAACGIFRPHLPWYAPKAYFDLYDLKEIQIPETLKNDLKDVGKMGNNMSKTTVHKAIIEENKWKEAVRAYLANLSFADACIGHLLEKLNNSPYANNTIIVLMGDHGWHLGEKEHWGKNVLWERSAKTPLLIYNPKDTKGKVSSKVVSLLDVYPTLVELSGLPKNKANEGKSLVPILKNKASKWNDLALTSKSKGTHSLRNKTYRYTVYEDGFEELYNHGKDPNEWENIANDPSSKEVLIMFRKKLNTILN
ncbi:sulfatase [Seonamhaeicola marinus]|uniref:Sulfatase n=1 Tax=Seonamhaeicola marinus TaxID=1912246 RepID=A0A5D0HK13_9FLAO|nr:sulfatase [Seonamhaeicola marinus]TYA71724.1 sulfatase [Seonamhaeicola marinus]